MQDYSFHRCTKRCKLSSRPLRPGEPYYSVVALKSGQTVRYDVSAAEWKEPPKDAIAWWQSEMPQAKPKAARPTPNSELLQNLAELCDQPGKENLAYLLAMLLVRRRALEMVADDDSSKESDVTMVCLRATSDGVEYRVYEPEETFTGDIVEETQAELVGMLTCLESDSADENSDVSPASTNALEASVAGAAESTTEWESALAEMSNHEAEQEVAPNGNADATLEQVPNSEDNNRRVA